MLTSAKTFQDHHGKHRYHHVLLEHAVPIIVILSEFLSLSSVFHSVSWWKLSFPLNTYVLLSLYVCVLRMHLSLVTS